MYSMKKFLKMTCYVDENWDLREYATGEYIRTATDGEKEACRAAQRKDGGFGAFEATIDQMEDYL